MFIAVLFSQIHAMEHYLAIKREEISTHDKTWVNLENMLIESSTNTGVHTETTCNLWAVCTQAMRLDLSSGLSFVCPIYRSSSVSQSWHN